eukprot:3926261-Pleurochrysis_carterae.AAC.1
MHSRYAFGVAYGCNATDARTPFDNAMLSSNKRCMRACQVTDLPAEQKRGEEHDREEHACIWAIDARSPSLSLSLSSSLRSLLYLDLHPSL